ncbi:hypothetical protein F4804DRAFT_299665 [Jackrogersella minutella]|nr:hypothetical protein F4804DRAFT_299665 [Jackrogersella minutella]
MAGYNYAYTGPYTTTGVHGPIPWYSLPPSAHHRPFGAFANGDIVPFPTIGHRSAHEEEEDRKQAEWLEWQGRLATTGGPARAEPRAAALEPREPRFRVWVLAAGVQCRGVKDRVAAHSRAAVDFAKAERGRLTFACERWYWLTKTAYEQSGWPQFLRFVRRLLALLFIVAAVVCVGKLKLDEMREERQEHQPTLGYVLVPQYEAWSVTKPCDCRAICDAKVEV